MNDREEHLMNEYEELNHSSWVSQGETRHIILALPDGSWVRLEGSSLIAVTETQFKSMIYDRVNSLTMATQCPNLRVSDLVTLEARENLMVNEPAAGVEESWRLSDYTSL